MRLFDVLRRRRAQEPGHFLEPVHDDVQPQQGHEPEEVAVGVTISSSTLGVIIPPSIPMVVYSSIASCSISALFIGGLGVFNSVQAYLQGKLGTLATLRALGLRPSRLA